MSFTQKQHVQIANNPGSPQCQTEAVLLCSSPSPSFFGYHLSLTIENRYNEFIVQYSFLLSAILKGECLKVIYFWFFVNMFPPGPLINLFSSFNILTFCNGIRNKRCTTAVRNSDGKFISVSTIDDRSCKFTIGVIFTSGHSFPQIYIDRLCCVKDAGVKFLSLILLVTYRRYQF